MDISTVLKSKYKVGEAFSVVEPYYENARSTITDLIVDTFTTATPNILAPIKKKWTTNLTVNQYTLQYCEIQHFKLLKLSFLTRLGSSILDIQKIHNSLVIIIELVDNDVVTVNTVWCDRQECKELCIPGYINDYLDWDPLF